MVDFGALPPEINSARMYMGPGSSSFQVAASAWNGLAAELQSAAQGYETTITQLASDEWNGPASAAMASAAQPYVTWMQETAAQAEQAATQAQAAAAAYEQAFAATVAPPLVAANRAETAAAVQANVFGQYTPLIAQLEAQYGQMWAQDAAAMYGYAGQSASAAQVTPFATPAATTNPGGTATQAAAVSQATGTSAATQQPVDPATADLVNAELAAKPCVAGGHLGGHHHHNAVSDRCIASSSGRPSCPRTSRRLVTNYSPYASLFYNTEGLPYFSVGMGNFGVQIAKSAGMLGGAAPAAAAPSTRRLGWPRRRAGRRWCCGAARARMQCPPFRAAPVRSANWRCRRRGSAWSCSAGGPTRLQLVSSVSAAPEAAGAVAGT